MPDVDVVAWLGFVVGKLFNGPLNLKYTVYFLNQLQKNPKIYRKTYIKQQNSSVVGRSSIYIRTLSWLLVMVVIEIKIVRCGSAGGYLPMLRLFLVIDM